MIKYNTMITMKQHVRDLKRDMLIILCSIIFAIVLTQAGILEIFLAVTEKTGILGSLVSGIFFTSIFTIAPASVALAHIGETVSPSTVAFFGAIGAMLGDFLILFCIKDVFMEDIKGVFKKSTYKKFLSVFHAGFFRWIIPLLGMLLIASPLPDEIGLAIIGASKIKTIFLLPIIFVTNFIGVLFIIYVGKML